ncbi:MAG: N-acylglucosamine 2-epimerase, partial [Nocardiopsaceae bacterium]|nr:N-acylglucosamine 2-epimerase [Nocardiopsaceae bacterium]
LAVAEAFLAGPDEIAIVGPPADEGTRALHRAAAIGATPGAVLALGGGADGPGDGVQGADGAGDGAAIPLLVGRALVQGKPAAYVCRNFTCRLPVTSAEELLATLGR